MQIIESSLEKLIFSVSQGHTKDIERHVANGVNINGALQDDHDKAPKGCTPLLASVMRTKTDSLETLIKLKADLNKLVEIHDKKKGIIHRTALIEACARKGKTDHILKLLDAKADVNILDSNKRSALSYLCSKPIDKHIEVFNLLLRNGADINNADAGGKTALIYAALAGPKNSEVKFIHNLVSNKIIDLKSVDGKENTAWCYANRNNNELVRQQIENAMTQIILDSTRLTPQFVSDDYCDMEFMDF